VNPRLFTTLLAVGLLTACGGSSDNPPPAADTAVDTAQDTASDTTEDTVLDTAAPAPDTATPPGKPADKYACNINGAGYCVFTGTPHPNGLQPGTSDIVDRDGNVLFPLSEAVAVNASGDVLQARGTPAFDGDHLIQSSLDGMTSDEQAFHRVMATLFPIRNALMYDIETLTQEEWDALVSELEKRDIKETTYTGGPTPKDNYYGRQGVFDLAKNPGGKDIHHPIMKFLEESGLYLLCHVTSDAFNQMLHETHPAGHDPCVDAGITTKISF